MSQLKIFRTSKSATHANPSYLIMVFDGTGSMHGEYKLMIDAYKTVFDEKILANQVHAIQFGSWFKYIITDIEPYLGSSWGNFNQAFENVLQKLKENIQADITICVVSDGHEYSNIKKLKEQIDSARQKYQIQFTSIAVGSYYPFELFQEFRDHFHNGTLSCTNVQFVERSCITGEDNCRKNFIKAFEIVKSQLTQSKKVQFEQLVWESINAQPSYFALEDVVVASMADQLTTKYGQQINQTRKAPDVAEFIQTSCQEFLKTQSNSRFKDSKEQAKEMKQVAQSLYKQLDQITDQKDQNFPDVIYLIQKDLVILDEISKGKLDLKSLSSQDKTQLLSDFNPKKTQEGPRLVQLEDEQNYENLQQELIYLFHSMTENPNLLINLQENLEIQSFLEQAQDMEKLAKDLFHKNDNSSWNKQNVEKFLQKLEKDLIILKIISQGKLNQHDLYEEKNLQLNSKPKKTETLMVKLVKQTDQPEQKTPKQKLISLLNKMAEVPRHLMVLQIMSNEKFQNSQQKAQEMKQIIQDLFIRGEQSTFYNEEIINRFIQSLAKDANILENLATGKDFLGIKDENRTKDLYEFVPKLLFYVAYLINYIICLILEQYRFKENSQI